MSRSEPTIEAEVVEIDGIRVQPNPASTGARPEWKEWRTWQGQIRRLDARWWPLWLVLGFVVLVLIAAVGMCALVVVISWKLLKSFAVGFMSIFLPGQNPVTARNVRS